MIGRRFLGFVMSVGLGAVLWSAPSLAATQKPQARHSSGVAAATSAAPGSRSVSVARRKAVGKATGRRALPTERPSQGMLQGLRSQSDPLELRSSVALVVDQETSEILFSKNPDAVLPIASITKLMTALVVVEAGQPLDEKLAVTEDDIDTEKGSRSRLAVGTQLTRREMLNLALMASENRAANLLGRYFDGGMSAMVNAMNRKAAELGMADTRYVEPTGLSSQNRSSAHDLARLVIEAHKHPLLREFSTAQDLSVSMGRRTIQFKNTNGLVRDPQWEIGLQKTGYISEAGRCLVMQAQLAGRNLVMVLLDSAGKFSRIADAQRIRLWLSAGTPLVSTAATAMTR